MAGVLGFIQQSVIYGAVNPHISTDLDNYEIYQFAPSVFDKWQLLQLGNYNDYRVIESNRWSITGVLQNSFFLDFYFRIQVSPLILNLQTVAASQTREINVWNAYPYRSATLNDILVSNPVGIEINGQSTPYLMTPLQELIYEVTLGVTGPPNINVEIQFDFSDVPNPSPILITGNRAVKFDLAPEVPVNESWEWLTDLMVSTDGTEQRIALRGEMPRVSTSLEFGLENEKIIRKFYADLFASVGRLYIPEYQYATKINQNCVIGSVEIYFDNAETDIRPGEYVLVQLLNATVLLSIETLETYGATVSSPLTINIPKDSYIMPGSPAIIDDRTGIDRYAPNNSGKLSMNCLFTRQREFLERPGTEIELPLFLGEPIVEKRPLASELVNDEFVTGQESIDNSTGLPDIISRWDYTRVGGERSFKVNRIKEPETLDYWKALFAHTRGQCRKFWVPTYRGDLHKLGIVSEGTDNLTIEGIEYATKVYISPTHRYLEIETDAGLHRVTVTSATEDGVNSIINFEPSLPTGEPWTQINRISYILPFRLASDKINWQHYGLESFLNFSIVTAEI